MGRRVMAAVVTSAALVALGSAAPPARPEPLPRSQEIGALPGLHEVAAASTCHVSPTDSPRGWLYRPASSAPVPAVVMLHKGFAYDSERAAAATQLLGRAYAAHLCPLGIAVLAVDYRFSALGLEEMNDVDAAFDRLAADPAIDATRIAVMGGSHGGYMTLLALERHDRPWAAGVALYGFGDVASVLARGMLDNPATRLTVHRLGPPVPGAASYRTISATDVGRITVPVLLMTGDHDEFVTDMRALHDQFVVHGGAVTYQEIAGAPHGFEVAAGAATAALWDRAGSFLAGVLRAKNGRSITA